jgi:hypothetical protein
MEFGAESDLEEAPYIKEKSNDPVSLPIQFLFIISSPV